MWESQAVCFVQDADTRCLDITDAMTVTKRHPDARLLADMDFGWRIVKHVKSNAIVVVKDGATVGVGAGQMNRVGSAGIALEEAKAAGATEGLVLSPPTDSCRLTTPWNRPPATAWPPSYSLEARSATRTLSRKPTRKVS